MGRLGAALVAVAVGGAAVAAAMPTVPSNGAGPDLAALADRLFDRLRGLRAAEGAPDIPRRPDLDAVASSRARKVAALPENRRLALEEPLETLLRQMGIRGLRSAAARLALLGGYADPAATAVEQWKGEGRGRTAALDERWNALGVGVAQAADGTLAFVAVFVEYEKIPRDLRALETRTERVVNDTRAGRGLPILAGSEDLREVARAHSEDMARRGYSGHRSPEGLGPSDRVRASGLRFRRLAENIAETRGEDDAVRAAVAGWLRSPGHRANLLDPEVSQTGVGVAVDPDGTFYFTQIFLEPPEAEPSPEPR